MQQEQVDPGFVLLSGDLPTAPLWTGLSLLERLRGGSGMGELEGVLAGGMGGIAGEGTVLGGARLSVRLGDARSVGALRLGGELGRVLWGNSGHYGSLGLEWSQPGLETGLDWVLYPENAPFLSLEGTGAALYRGGQGLAFALDAQGRRLRTHLGGNLRPWVDRLTLGVSLRSGWGQAGLELLRGDVRVGWEALCGCVGVGLFYRYDGAEGSAWGVQGAPASTFPLATP